MSELDEIEMERKVAGGILQQFICRASKKNHEGMVQLAKEVTDIFTKHGEYFQLGNTGDMVVFTNIAKLPRQAKTRRIVWNGSSLGITSIKKKNTSQSVQVTINTERHYKQFIYLITPDSAVMSEFNHICSVGD
jgi:hypothetical protein